MSIKYYLIVLSFINKGMFSKLTENVDLVLQQITKEYNPYQLINFIPQNDSNKTFSNLPIKHVTPKYLFEIDFQKEKNQT